MPTGLRRIYGRRHLHFITCSCYRRQPKLDTARARDVFLEVLEKVRVEFRFVVVGYVVMPEHFHLLIAEPDIGDPSAVMHALKQRVALRLLANRRRRSRQMRLWEEPKTGTRYLWQPRFFDFNVFTEKKRIEKLRYMHRSPVKRGLVDAPDLWRGSSFRFYAYAEQGPVKLLERPKDKETEGAVKGPPFAEPRRKKRGSSRKGWGTQLLFLNGE